MDRRRSVLSSMQSLVWLTVTAISGTGEDSACAVLTGEGLSIGDDPGGAWRNVSSLHWYHLAADGHASETKPSTPPGMSYSKRVPIEKHGAGVLSDSGDTVSHNSFQLRFALSSQ